MKKIVCVCAAFLLTLMLCSCTLSRGDQYVNFTDDFDVVTRMQTALEQQKGGGMTAYVEADIQTLKEDLRTLETQDKELLRLNEHFMEAAQLLLDSAAFAKEKDTDASRIAYLKAKASFDRGLKALYSLPAEEGRPTDG